MLRDNCLEAADEIRAGLFNLIFILPKKFSGDKQVKASDKPVRPVDSSTPSSFSAVLHHTPDDKAYLKVQRRGSGTLMISADMDKIKSKSTAPVTESGQFLNNGFRHLSF